MLRSSVNLGLLQGYPNGVGSTLQQSHLQFTDDTLMVGGKSWVNIRTRKANLLLLDLVLGIKVNFQKSLIVKVNVSISWLEEVANMLNCKMGKLLSKYLSLPIGYQCGRGVIYLLRSDLFFCRLTCLICRYSLFSS